MSEDAPAPKRFTYAFCALAGSMTGFMLGMIVGERDSMEYHKFPKELLTYGSRLQTYENR